MTHRWLAALTVSALGLMVAACGSGTSTAPTNPPLSAAASAQLAGLRDQCVGMAGVFLVDRSPAASHQTPYGCRYIGLDGRTSVNFVGTEDGNYGYVDTTREMTPLGPVDGVPVVGAPNAVAGY